MSRYATQNRQSLAARSTRQNLSRPVSVKSDADATPSLDDKHLTIIPELNSFSGLGFSGTMGKQYRETPVKSGPKAFSAMCIVPSPSVDHGALRRRSGFVPQLDFLSATMPKKSCSARQVSKF